MRHFRLQRNQQFSPSVNLDKLWSLVSEATRAKAVATKDKAAVIDVTKAVNYYYPISIPASYRAFSRSSVREPSPTSPSSSRPSSSPRPPRRESRKQVALAFSLHEHSQFLLQYAAAWQRAAPQLHEKKFINTR